MFTFWYNSFSSSRELCYFLCEHYTVFVEGYHERDTNFISTFCPNLHLGVRVHSSLKHQVIFKLSDCYGRSICFFFSSPRNPDKSDNRMVCWLPNPVSSISFPSLYHIFLKFIFQVLLSTKSSSVILLFLLIYSRRGTGLASQIRGWCQHTLYLFCLIKCSQRYIVRN